MNTQANADVDLLRKRNNLRWPLRARIVLEKYRLNALDLEQILRSGRNGFATRIVNVSLEGVEELHVLLHLHGLSKPLRLTQQQRQQIAEILQSHHFADWLDQSIELSIAQPIQGNAERNHIELTILSVDHPAPQPKSTASNSNTTTRHQEVAAAQQPDTPQPTPHRIARTHFSGAGDEFSVLDPDAGSKRRTRFRRDISDAFTLPEWLQQFGQSALLRQVRSVFDANVLLALLLFLLIVAAVQFEAILNIVASLFGQ